MLMRWLVMATLAAGLCSAAAAHAASPLDAPDPLAGPTCNWSQPDPTAIQEMYDRLVKWWSARVSGTPAQKGWNDNPLQLEIKGQTLHLSQTHEYSPRTNWPWNYKAIALLDAPDFFNLSFEQYTTPAHKDEFRYKWFI